MSKKARNQTRQPNRQISIDADVDVDSAFENLVKARTRMKASFKPEWVGGRMTKHDEGWHNQISFTLERVKVLISRSLIQVSYHPDDEKSFWHVLTLLQNLGICHPSQWRDDNDPIRRFAAEKVSEEFKKKIEDLQKRNSAGANRD